MSALDVVALVVVALALPASAALAITDTVLTQVTRARVEALADEQPQRPALASLRRMLAQRDEALHPVLLLELVFDVVAAGLTAVVVYRLGGGWAVLAAFIVGFPLMFLVAVSLPRAWALHNLDRAIAVAAPAGAGVARLWPVRVLAELGLAIGRRWFPPAERRTIDDLGDQSFVVMAGSPSEADRIDFEDQQLLASVIEFGSTVVREIMVPRPDMVCLSVELALGDAVAMVQAEGYSRFPVTGESIDDVIGVLYAKDVANAALSGSVGRTLAELVRPARFVPELKTVASLLREMQLEKLHLAVVVDEYGGTAGLVTMEDIIEELVGDIEDEFDEAGPAIEEQPDGSRRLQARLLLEEVNDELGLHLPEGDWDTVGGLVFDYFGTIPSVGDVARFGDHELEVSSMRGRRIDALVLRAVPVPADPASPAGSAAGAAGPPEAPRRAGTPR